MNVQILHFPFAENLLEYVTKEDLNLCECVAFTVDMKCANILYEELINLYKSQNAMTHLKQNDQSRFAKILQDRLRNAFHYACALGNYNVFDFLLVKCIPTGTVAKNHVQSSSIDSHHLDKFR